ncbi:MmgE/PrpD family protein [Williamsia soli]|uniref:MmgE/PrpD family protein n=1 Tax=Williamsia soli TaxID=364929 RepID=UPI001A9EA23B|nr:MmgE/PrpD family protein [Williamsia soli]
MIASELAGFASELTIEDVPRPVRDRAVLHLADCLGIAVASTTMDFGESVHRAGIRLGRGEDSRVLGWGTPLPAASAALVNGTLIHGLDFDDTHIEAIHHASAPALASALSVAEAEDAGGTDLLLAYIIGIEVGTRLAIAGQGEFHDRGFHPTGILGTFGAVCATGSVRGSSPETIVRAMGLAGSQAAGILELHHSWLKRLHPGWAAHSGIVASTLAEEGFIGPASVFEGDNGLFMSHLGRVPDRTALHLDDLGSHWMSAELALKPYPCCHFTHAFIDAALELREQLLDSGRSLDDIASISAPTSERLIPAVAAPVDRRIAPETIYDALFSIQFAVALALQQGRVDLASFYDQPLDDPAVRRIAALVTCPVDEQSDYPAHFPGEVVITFNDGSVLQKRHASSRGTHEQPLTESEVVAKFRSNVTRRWDEATAEEVSKTVLEVENLSVSQLVDAFSETAGRRGAQ